MESSLSPQEKQKYITAQNTPGTREYYAIRIAAAGQYGDRSEVARLSGLLRNMPAIPPPAAVSPSQIIGWANLSPPPRQLMIDSGQVIGTRTSPPPNAPSVPSAPPSPALDRKSTHLNSSHSQISDFSLFLKYKNIIFLY